MDSAVTLAMGCSEGCRLGVSPRTERPVADSGGRARTQLGEALCVEKSVANRFSRLRTRGTEGKAPPSLLAYAPDLECYHRSM